jgi:tetratricopeptide (TPR) repeat protein
MRKMGAIVGVWMAGSLALAWAGGPPEAYVEGVRLAREGKYLGALDALRQAARERPDQPGLHYNTGNVLRHLGEHGEAIKAYQEAIRQDPGDADAYYNMAMTYSVMDEMDLALAALEAVVRLRPEDGEAHYRLAMGFHSRRELDLARKHLGLALRAGYPVPPALREALEAPPAGKTGAGKGSF